MPEVEIKARLTPEQAQEFGVRVARDDEFRAGLETNLEQTLEQAGYDIEFSGPFTVTLPPKEAVEEALPEETVARIPSFIAVFKKLLFRN